VRGISALFPPPLFYSLICLLLGTRQNLNLERLDKKDMNVRLKKLPRIFQSLYENGEPMSQASVDFLERAYKRKKKPAPRYVWVYTGKDK